MSLRTHALAAAAALALALATPAAQAAAACTEASGVCLIGSGAKWEADASLTAKQIKAKRKGAACKVSFEIDGGRGSVFIDGRYAATAPNSTLSLTPGKHDIQVRDGQKILAEGVLTVPKGGSLVVTIRHD